MHSIHVIYTFFIYCKDIYFCLQFYWLYTRGVIYHLTASQMPIRKVTNRNSCQNRTDFSHQKLNKLNASNNNKNNPLFLAAMKATESCAN